MGKTIFEGPIPDGLKLYATLIDLLADQEGVTITYTLVKENEQGEVIRTLEGCSDKRKARKAG